MEKAEEKTPKVGFQWRDSTYKIIVPLEVEKKIRYLCQYISDVEWSGILFYKVDGSFKKDDLVITCLDLYQMDEGNSTYTEFESSPDIMSYMVDHPELMEVGVYQGLIHSHNKMKAFFSGTDCNTLREKGMIMNHYVSLIVNNAGDYVAAVTRNAEIYQDIIQSATFATWEDSESTIKEAFKDKKGNVIEAFNLVVEVQRVSYSPEDELYSRIKEVRDKKAPVPKVTYYPPTKSYTNTPINIPVKNEPRQTELPFEDADGSKTQDFYIENEPNHKAIMTLVKQIITGSIILPNDSGIDVKKWAKSMNALYTKRFGTIEEFKAFASNYIEFIVNSNVEDLGLSKTLEWDEVSAIIAFYITLELEDLPSNDWLDAYIEILNEYVI